MMRTHRLRRASGLLFALLFCFFSLAFVRFVFARFRSYANADWRAALAALPVVLYVSLVPAALCHGALAAVAAAARECVGGGGGGEEQQQEEVASEQPAAPSLVAAAKASILGLPAVSHAVANVATRLLLKAAAAGIILSTAWSQLPALLDLLASSMHSLAAWIEQCLPRVYPYLEAIVLFLVKWIPIAHESCVKAVSSVWTRGYAFCIYAGNLIHDSWDPVIVPVLQFVGSSLHYVSICFVTGVHRLKDRSLTGMTLCHDALAWLVLQYLDFHHRVLLFMNPYFTVLTEFAVKAWLSVTIFTKVVLDAIHQFAALLVHVYIDWKIPELMANIFHGIVTIGKSLISWSLFIASKAHNVLEFLCHLIYNSTLLAAVWRKMESLFIYCYPILTRFVHATYLVAVEIIAQTKILALPVIQTLHSITTHCINTSYVFAQWLSVIIANTEWFKLIQSVLEWDLWVLLSTQVTLITTQAQSALNSFVSRTQDAMEKNVARVVGQVEKGVSSVLYGVDRKRETAPNDSPTATSSDTHKKAD